MGVPPQKKVGRLTQCNLEVLINPGVSIWFEFRDFFQFHFGADLTQEELDHNQRVIGELREFFHNTATAVATDIVQDFQSARIRMSLTGSYSKNDGELLHHIGKSTNEMVIYRHEARRADVINGMITKLFAPEELLADGIEGAGSALTRLVNISEVDIQIITPIQYNANALSTSMRLYTGLGINQFVKYLPYNKDRYCVLHCLLKTKLNKYDKERRIVTDDEEYAEKFNKFVKDHDLERFYQGDLFLIDLLPELEAELQMAVNIFLLEEVNQPLTLFYRSEFKYSTEPVDIVIIPMNYFYNIRTTESPEFKDPITSNKSPNNQTHLSKVGIKQRFNTVDGHAVVINRNVFSSWVNLGGGYVCKYCHKVTKDLGHEAMCLEYFQGVKVADRTKTYKEAKKPVLDFTKWYAVYRVPFCTFDFETRLVDNKHVAYSFAIMYFNVFEPKKSKIIMKSNTDEKKLIEEFIAGCKELTMHHHDDIQSIEHARNIPQRENDDCKFCGNKFDDKNFKPQFNHSHFVGDNLNTQYDCYICHVCNSRAQLRNQPLKFYAHNGSRYDFNLFLPAFLVDDELKQHSFLGKNESRFTQVVLGFSKSGSDLTWNDKMHRDECRYKLSFNDSVLLVGGSLESNCKAWIDKIGNAALLKTLMGVFYGHNLEGLQTLVNQSFNKQVFPYTALNDTNMVYSQEPIAKEYFRDTFINKECNEKDYQEYLQANQILKEATGYSDYCFGDYHDYYLLLDVVLLGVILYNFMNLNHDLNGTNPLAFLSTSSYTFNSFLKHNKNNNQPKIVLPSVDVQRYVKKSIHGGFTMIFNKTNLKGPKDYTFYVDFTSLYPTIMSLHKLPTKFVGWKEPLESIKETTEWLKSCSDVSYFFIEADIAPLAKKFQKKVSMYPMFPETQTIFAEEYSKDQEERWKINSGSSKFKDQEINTVTFFEKKNYICSWDYLKTALEVGYEVTKIHKIAVFEKEFVTKDYIDKVYKLKKDGKARLSTLVKDSAEYKAECSRITVYKVILNALYGYTIVNSDKHKEVELFDVETDNELLHKRVSSPRFISMIQCGKKAVVSQMKASYTLEYPLMIGSAILFESKLMTAKFMYSLYDHLEKMGNGLEIHPCMMDTDSVVLSIKNFKNHWKNYDHFAYEFNQNVYPLFDTSGAEDPQYQMPETHDALGYMTNETDGEEIIDFIATGPKCYSFKTADSEKVKGKGISLKLQKSLLNFNLYKSVVDGSIFEPNGTFNDKKYTTKFNDFRSARFGISTVATEKKFVTLVDMKAYYGTNSTEYAIFGSEKHLKAVSEERD